MERVEKKYLYRKTTVEDNQVKEGWLNKRRAHSSKPASTEETQQAFWNTFF